MPNHQRAIIVEYAAKHYTKSCAVTVLMEIVRQGFWRICSKPLVAATHSSIENSSNRLHRPERTSWSIKHFFQSAEQRIMYKLKNVCRVIYPECLRAREVQNLSSVEIRVMATANLLWEVQFSSSQQDAFPSSLDNSEVDSNWDHVTLNVSNRSGTMRQYF